MIDKIALYYVIILVKDSAFSVDHRGLKLEITRDLTRGTFSGTTGYGGLTGNLNPLPHHHKFFRSCQEEPFTVRQRQKRNEKAPRREKATSM